MDEELSDLPKNDQQSRDEHLAMRLRTCLECEWLRGNVKVITHEEKYQRCAEGCVFSQLVESAIGRIACERNERQGLEVKVKKLEHVADAAKRGCRNCRFEDDDIIMCYERAGCGFADTRAALAALEQQAEEGMMEIKTTREDRLYNALHLVRYYLMNITVVSEVNPVTKEVRCALCGSRRLVSSGNLYEAVMMRRVPQEAQEALNTLAKLAEEGGDDGRASE